jgi:hypothetical protein
MHQTTMTPATLELLAGWPPSQPWYRTTGQAPELTRAGGFRLDDPEGEVGTEFMVVADGQDGQPTAWPHGVQPAGGERESAGQFRQFFVGPELQAFIASTGALSGPPRPPSPAPSRQWTSSSPRARQKCHRHRTFFMIPKDF